MNRVRRKLLISLLLAGITFGLYWPSRTHDLIYFDDPMFITENAQIKTGLSWRSFRYAFTDSIIGNWHPLTTLSHMLDCQLFDGNPGPHHLVSAAIHSINAALLFLVLVQMTGGLWRSALVAAIFAWHPLRLESVAWIAERKDVLSGFFFLLTLWTYAKYVQSLKSKVSSLNSEEQSKVQSPTSKVVWYASCLLLFALGLMSKPMLVTTPFVLLLLDYWPLKRFELKIQNSKLKSCLIEKLPFLALSAILSIITLNLQKGVAEANTAIAFEHRLANAAVSYTRYLGKLFCPTRLAIIYPHLATSRTEFEYWYGWRLLLAALLLVAVSVGCVLLLRRAPYLVFGWLWFLGTLIPVIGLVQVGAQGMADRYTYIPLIGPVIALVWFIADLWPPGRFRNTFFAVFAAVLCLAILLSTHFQLRYWRDSITLFSHALDVTSENPSVESSLGIAYQRQGLSSEAMIHYRKALELNPSDEQAHFELGQLLRKQEKWQEAANEYFAALQFNPNNLDTLLNLANVLNRLGRFDDAVSVYNQALNVQPDSIEALNNLAWLLATCPLDSIRNGARATELALRACELTRYRQTTFLGTLAAAYAEAGKFPDAIATAEKACSNAAQLDEQALLAKNQELLNLYRSGKPYRENIP